MSDRESWMKVVDQGRDSNTISAPPVAVLSSSSRGEAWRPFRPGGAHLVFPPEER